MNPATSDRERAQLVSYFSRVLPCFLVTSMRSMISTPYSGFLSVAVMKHSDQKQLGEERKGLFELHFQVTIHHCGKAGWELKQALKQNSWERLLAGSLSLAYAQTVLLGKPGPPTQGGTALSGLEPPQQPTRQFFIDTVIRTISFRNSCFQ